MTSECRHLNWRINESNPFGRVSCKDCGKEIWATDALNNMSEYMSSLIRELEALVNPEPKKPGRPKKNG
jgi:hypothetical protein